MKKIGIGTSDFKVLREDKNYYIDKTKNIIEFLEEVNGKIILMPRPRRFGKTLFLSTLKYFFSNREKNSEIFKDTYIYNTPFFKEHFGQYPVIYLTLKDLRERDFDTMIEKLKGIISNEVSYLLKDIDLNSLKLEQNEKETLNNILSLNASIVEYENSIKYLSKALRLYYNKEILLFIDEYDTPIQTAFLKGYYEDTIEFFRNFLGTAFKDNDTNIKKVLLTGILRVSGESMFSGLNNLVNLTILENDMCTSCGFTLKETKQMLIDYNIAQPKIDKAIRWYNGYIFGDNTVIFNPWSIINFVNFGKFETYWANTSSNDLILDLIDRSNEFKSSLQTLISGEPIDIQINSNITFRKNELYQKETLFSFLFFSGYLKCKEKYIKKIYDSFSDGDYIEQLYCKLVPTNVECRTIFHNIISKYVNNSFFNHSLDNLLNSLINGEIKLFEKLFSYLLRDTLSYHDTKTENSYHTFLLGILVNLSYEYEIISNSEAGYGRVDIILLHKEDKNKPAIIMELKTIDTFEEETKDKALLNAINQIKEKNYISYVKKRGYHNIIAFGLVFDGKRCWVERV